MKFIKAGRIILTLIVTSTIFSCIKYNTKKESKTDLKKPNIVLILADDLGYGDLSCYGQTHYSTPNIDKLATEGIRFTQHYAGNTVCSPSRYSLMTGENMGHAILRGNGRNTNGPGDFPLPPNKITFAEHLQKEGYKTGIFGKWGLGDCGTEGSPLDHGFDEFYGYTDQILAHNSFPEYLLKNCKKVFLRNKVEYLDKNAWHKGLGSVTTKKVDYSNDLILSEALGFIKKNKSVPFFLYFPTTIPHMNDEAEIGKHFEIQNSAEFDGKNWSEDEKHYALLIKRLDKYVGEIVEKLKELDLLSSTLIIFTSDNGAVSGLDHLNVNGKLRGYKRDLYEGGIRVPFIAKWEGKIKANTVSDHISAFWDYYPTLLEVANCKSTASIDGISFLPTLINKGEQKEHKYLYWEFHWWKPTKQAIRMGKWKGIKNAPDAEIELYDFNLDLSEIHNVAEDQKKIIDKMENIFVSLKSDESIKN